MQNFSLTRKEIISLILAIFLLIAIPVVITLLRQQQVLKSRADVIPVRFPQGAGVEVINDVAVAIDDDIEIEVNAPTVR